MIVDLNLNWLPIPDLVATLTVLLVLVIVRFVVSRAIQARGELAPHLQRRWIATVRNVCLAFGVLALALIWAPQLQTFALSLTAVAVAIVVATKELLLCFSGAFLRASSRAFVVGDWIEVAGVRGEVVDHNLFATTVHEFDSAPGSYNFIGRTAVVPNSALLTSPARNLSSHRNHIYHSFEITFDATADVFANRATIESIVAAHAAPYEDAARRANAAMEKEAGVDLLDPAARVRFITTDIGNHRILITLFCPPAVAEKLQNEITCEVALAIGQTRAQRGELSDG